jgi:hypothetical protein
MDRKVRNRLVPGASLLDDHNTWAPEVPRDLLKRTPVADDGTAKCDLCSKSFPIAALDVTYRGYMCGACTVTAAQRDNPAPVNPDNVKVGRGRWWIMPIVIVVGGAITIVYPVAALVTVVVVAMLVFRLILRRGI